MLLLYLVSCLLCELFLFILSGANPFLGHAALSQEALSAVFVLLLVLNLLVSLLEDAVSSLFFHVLVVVLCFLLSACLSSLFSCLSPLFTRFVLSSFIGSSVLPSLSSLSSLLSPLFSWGHLLSLLFAPLSSRGITYWIDDHLMLPFVCFCALLSCVFSSLFLFGSLMIIIRRAMGPSAC